MYKSIVIAAALFNEGQTTRAALSKATRMISEGGKITLVHVIEDIPGYVAAAIPQAQMTSRRNEVEDQLAAIAAEAEGATIETVIRQGQPAATILAAAEAADGDLIMIASHKPGLSDYFIGSTAARIVRHAQISVLVSR